MSFSDTITAIVGAVVERMGFHYLALREYRVSSQNADGTLELEAMEKNKPGALPGLSNVRIMQIGPGSSIKPGPRSTVLVGFKNGDQTRRYALGLWDGSQATQMIIECLDLQLGGQTSSFAVKGTEYINARNAYFTTIQTALGTAINALTATLPNPASSAILPLLNAWNGAITAFRAVNVLATNVKVK